MTQISVEKDTALLRISEIVDRLLHSNSVYRDLDKQEMLEIFGKLLEKVSPTEVLSLSDEPLTKRVDGVMAIEAMSHLLDDFTDEQKETFFDAVEGR